MNLGSYDAKKLDLFLGFKVKSQLCAWMTSAAVCTEGFCKERNYSWVRGLEIVRRELQLSAQLEIVRKELQLSAQLDLKDGSAAECTDQNCCFVRVE